jgi:hypothetical protein
LRSGLEYQDEKCYPIVMSTERPKPLVFDPNLAEATITQPEFVNRQLGRIVGELAVLIKPEDDPDGLRFQSATILQGLIESGTPPDQVEAVSAHFKTLQARGDHHMAGNYIDSRTGFPRNKTFFLARQAVLERVFPSVATVALVGDLRYLHAYNVLLSEEAGNVVKIGLSDVLLKVACRYNAVPFILTGDSFLLWSYKKPMVTKKEIESWMGEIDQERQLLTENTLIASVALGMPIIDRSSGQRIYLSAEEYNNLIIGSEAGPQTAQILFPPIITMTHVVLPPEFEHTQAAITKAMKDIEDLKLAHADELEKQYPDGFKLLQRVRTNSTLSQAPVA